MRTKNQTTGPESVIRTAEQINVLYNVDLISKGISFREKLRVFFDRDKKVKRILNLCGEELFYTNAW